MSIPSINFRRSPTRSPGGPRVATRTSLVQRSNSTRSPTKVQIEFSSSVSDSDDIPMLASKKDPKKATTAILESDSSYEHSDVEKKKPEPMEELESEDISEPEPEPEPEPKRRAPPKRRPPVRRQQQKTRPKKGDAEYSYSYSYSDEVQVPKRVTPPSSPPKSPKPSPPQQQHEEEERIETAPESIPEQIPVDDNMKEFSIAREKTKKSVSFHLLRGEKGIYFSRPCKDGIGKLQMVSTCVDLDECKHPKVVGLVRFNSRGKKFGVMTNEQKENDDREPNIAGGAIYQNKQEKVRSCKIVITRDGKPVWPISARRDLATIATAATKGEEVSDHYRILNARRGWELTTEEAKEFGDILIEKSCKNFIIEDEQKQILFMLYKKGDGLFGVKCRYPITPFIGFGIGMGIISAK